MLYSVVGFFYFAVGAILALAQIKNKKLQKYTIIILFILLGLNLKAEFISIQIPKELEQEKITKIAIEDFADLLVKSCDCSVTLDGKEAEINIVLPVPKLEKFKGARDAINQNEIPIFYYPATSYKWKSEVIKDQVRMTLEADSYEGIAAGLYGLLQEKFGFSFYHPRRTIIPEIKDWQQEKNWTWTAKERFNKRGFHLHTMHPIELTEALLDHDFPDGQKMIKEYIDWLARNGQNYFEFNLLNTVDLKKWIPYIKEVVDYGHERGIIMGLDLSLHMIQQKAFMLYKNPPASLKSKEKQIIQNLNALAEAGWDVYNIEFSSTEFTSGNVKKKKKLQQLITDWALENRAKIMGRAHVVKKEGKVLSYETENKNIEESLDKHRGVLIHTVMFYEINEEKAPVYENENLKHMLDLLKAEQSKRETWYFPESAYWVTFDNSIPLLLLPYLSARLNDILLMEKMEVPGHITFSSGWEWGYWLVDWSIARWSWKYGEDEVNAVDGISKIFQDENITVAFKEILKLQETYFKDQELMRYMVAQTVTDEVPKPIRFEFHPRPRWRFKDLFRNVNQAVLDSLKNEALLQLENFIQASEAAQKNFEDAFFNTKMDKNDMLIFAELSLANRVTNLRASHRLQTLNAIVNHRAQKLSKDVIDSTNHYLQMAEATRKNALLKVKEQEEIYRYDLNNITRKRKGHTAYHFGYLYPVHNLHFWEREESQIKKNKWGFTHKNIWNVWRILGVVR